MPQSAEQANRSFLAQNQAAWPTKAVLCTASSMVAAGPVAHTVRFRTIWLKTGSYATGL